MSKKEKDNIVRKALIEAKRLKKGSEELITQQIVESLSPQIKNQISKMVSEMDDFDEEDEYVEEGEDEIEDETDFEADFSEEGGEEEEYVEEGDEDEEYEEDTDDVDVDVDTDDEEFVEEAIDDAEVEDFINQLESYLKEEEEGDDADGDGHVEVPTDEVPSEDDELEEGEGSDEDDEDDKEDLDESSDEKDSKYKMKYESLKKDFNEMYKILKETSLEVERSRIYQEVASTKKITESKKLSLMKALDNASSTRELKRVQESFNLAWDDNTSTAKKKKSSNKKRVSESKTRARRGSFSKGVKTSMKGKKKKLQESKQIIAPDAVAKLAEWADIK